MVETFLLIDLCEMAPAASAVSESSSKPSTGLNDPWVPAEVADTLAAVKLWQPPVVRGLVIATSGRFSADAVAWAEQHNDGGAAPIIELWPESKLETLLAQKPYLAAAHGLR